MGNRTNDHLICVIGAPGSGKGTLCSRLSDEYGFVHVSVGDVLRDKAKDDQEIMEHVRASKLLPTKKILAVLKDKLALERDNGNIKILLDGFPRRMDQAIAFEEIVMKPDLVVLFNCPKKVACERFLTRKLPGRLDDDEAIFEKRHQEYEKETPPVIEYFSSGNRLIKVDTSTETNISYQKLVDALKTPLEEMGGA